MGFFLKSAELPPLASVFSFLFSFSLLFSFLSFLSWQTQGRKSEDPKSPSSAPLPSAQKGGEEVRIWRWCTYIPRSKKGKSCKTLSIYSAIKNRNETREAFLRNKGGNSFRVQFTPSFRSRRSLPKRHFIITRENRLCFMIAKKPFFNERIWIRAKTESGLIKRTFSDSVLRLWQKGTTVRNFAQKILLLTNPTVLFIYPFKYCWQKILLSSCRIPILNDALGAC